MRLFNGLEIGFKSFFEAIGFIFKNRLYHYFLYPIVLTIALWLAGIGAIQFIVNFIETQVSGTLHLEPSTVEDGFFDFFWNFWELIKNGLNSFSTLVLAFILKIIFFYLTAILMKYIVLAALSPVFALLSEKTEEILTGNRYPFNAVQFFRDVLRGILIAMRNMCVEIGIMVLVWLITIVFPIIAPITGIFLFLLSAYFYGFSMIDYNNERRRLTLKESIRFVRENMGMAIALGFFIAIIPEIPVLILKVIASFVISSAAIVSVVGATLAVHKKVDLSKNKILSG